MAQLFEGQRYHRKMPLLNQASFWTSCRPSGRLFYTRKQVDDGRTRNQQRIGGISNMALLASPACRVPAAFRVGIVLYTQKRNRSYYFLDRKSAVGYLICSYRRIVVGGDHRRLRRPTSGAQISRSGCSPTSSPTSARTTGRSAGARSNPACVKRFPTGDLAPA